MEPRKSEFGISSIVQWWIILTIISSCCHALHAESPVLVAPNGQFLGNVNSNRYDYNSIANPSGPYGSPLNPTSIYSPVSPYGNPYSPSYIGNSFAHPNGLRVR